MTVTDLNLAAGRIDPKFYFNGQLALNKGAVIDRLQKMFPEENVSHAARKMLALVANKLATEIRRKLFEKGCDPRDFVLCSFGGAAGLHCCEAADELGIRQIIVPLNASVLSAFGILMGQLVFDKTVALASVDPRQLQNAFFHKLIKGVYRELKKEAESGGIKLLEGDFEVFFNIGYRKQSYLIPVRMAGKVLQRQYRNKGYLARRLIDEFTKLHRQSFGFTYDDNVGLQLVSAYCRFRGTHPGMSAESLPPMGSGDRKNGRGPLHRVKRLAFKAKRRRLVLEGASSVSASGPCFLEARNSTIYVSPRWHAQVDKDFIYLNRSGSAA